MPSPVSFVLNNPSPPATDEKLFLDCTDKFTELSAARNNPSSITSPSGCSLISKRMMCLYVGSSIRNPLPLYSGFMTLSLVTMLLPSLPSRSFAPETPVVASMLPSDHCMAPACVITPVSPFIITRSCLCLTPISDMKYLLTDSIGDTLKSRVCSRIWKGPFCSIIFLFSFVRLLIFIKFRARRNCPSPFYNV